MGRLETVPALEHPEMLAPPVAAAVATWEGPELHVAPIDPDLADTASFCAAYDVPLEASANCVVVAGRRGADVRTAACVVLATTRADVNGAVRRALDVRKASFAPHADAVAQTGMEHGGITPFGLPADWPVLVDPAVLAAPLVVVGSGLRRSKLVVPGHALGRLAAARVLEGLGVPQP
jgi:prolyl-tRNA editing enzyme YbaK/EbsC (Cys-tRNA(Pro) deacylase)